MTKKKPAGAKSGKGKRSDIPSIDHQSAFRSMESFMAGLGVGGRRKLRAVDEAQEVMYDAWEATTSRQAVALARKALAISPDCADAYVLLAQETAGSLAEEIDLYRNGVAAGERALGKKAFREDVGLFWGILETRPYMRARAGLAQSLWEAGEHDEAIAHYQDMLRLNPNDNQGLRDLLMPCLIELGRDEEAYKLLEQYKDDGMAVWMYSRALLDFRKHGDSPAARKSLQAAIKVNAHIPAYLLGRRRVPRRLPDHYGYGDENEAALYAHGNRAIWKATKGAVDWLAANVA